MREMLAGVALVLSLLLLFGCVGPQERAVPQKPADSGIGDRQISVSEEQEDETLYVEEEVIEPPEVDETADGQPEEEAGPDTPAYELTLSDIDVFEESDFDIMMSEDIIEP